MIDAGRALGAYAAVMTLAVAWLGLTGVVAGPAKLIEAERINIREPDGTLRLAISSHARMPGIVLGNKEYPHPNRPEAGMIFYDDQGSENGGLVFDGGWKKGRPTNGGSLTFDRWHQDQTIQLRSTEDGPAREAALVVNDRPDGPMDFPAAAGILAMPPGPARDSAIDRGNFRGRERAYLGRDATGNAQVVLRDGEGRPRLRMRVAADGAASIVVLDTAGKVVRTL